MNDVDNTRALLAAFYQAFNDHDLDRLDLVLAADIVDHHPGPGQTPGIVGLKDSLREFRAAFPDMEVVNQAVVIDGDLAMVRSRCRGTHLGELRGLPPSGATVDFTAIDNWRIRDGRLVEVWHVEDIVRMLVQIGVLAE